MWQMNRKYSKLNYQWSKQACNNIFVYERITK
uniref:Uncharacterized protein n=1 Tax=Anguilla anguilla TaxID=7936 RepID=A0A0E9TV58_ANGAN